MRTTLFIALLVAAPLAVAQSIPRFDVEASCENVASVAGGSYQIYNSCIQMEQRSYNTLRNRWSDIDAGIQRSCIEVAGYGGYSYQILESCIQIEENAAGNRQTFSFD